MARPNSSPHPRRRTTVPVASRAAERKAHEEATARAKAIAARRGPNRMDIAGIAVLIAVVLVILLAIAVPLRNYYDGRTEIARLNDSIAAKQEEKEQLISDINRYKDEDYIRQEARRRLGVVEPGETAYRIVDPKMSHDESLTTDKRAEADERKWYEVLWGSVTEEDASLVVSGNSDSGEASPLPTAESVPPAQSDDAGAVQDSAPNQSGN